MTIITTDSGSNPRNMNNMAPCIINSNETYYDMVEGTDNIKSISNIEVFDRAIAGERFHTAAPNINDIIAIMRPYLENGDEVVHLSMSSGISEGSVNGAKVASEMLNDEYGDKVSFIDTLTGGSGGTLLNDYANDLSIKGLSKNEIVNEIEKVKKRLLTSYYISKVEGFVNSGRAPREAKLLDKLSFRYRIDINDKGKLVPKLPPYRGSISSQFMKHLTTIINDNNKYMYDSNYFALLITKLKDIDINEVKEYLKGLNYFSESMLEEVPFYGAISSYGVEDQVGIALIKK